MTAPLSGADSSPEFDWCRWVLEERFGIKHVHHNSSNDQFTIDIPPPPGGDEMLQRRFTWQQAKYLSVRDVSDDDLRNGRFPEDWPAT
jgi:hypothetical protein